MTVVGVVGDVRNDLARPDAAPMAYRSHRQESTRPALRPPPHAGRADGARETPPARARGARPLAARPARHDAAGGGRRRARRPAASGHADDRVRRPGPAPRLGRRLWHVRQHGRGTGAGVRRAHGARLAPARDRRAHAAAGRRLDGRRPVGRRARDDRWSCSFCAAGSTECRRSTRSPSAVPSRSWWLARRSPCSFPSAAPRGWTRWSRSAPNEAVTYLPPPIAKLGAAGLYRYW